MPPLESVLTALLSPSPLVFGVGILVVLLVPVLLHVLLTSTTSYTTLPNILLLGPPSGGKTSLATLFERGPQAGASKTHTSQVVGTVELTASSGEGYTDAGRETTSQGGSGSNHTKFLLVDVPGHGKLRESALGRLAKEEVERSRVKGIVFVVDAAALTEKEALSETADYLHSVLLSLQKLHSTKKRNVPVLIAANKLDLFTALPTQLVQTQLETEITKIRTSRSKGLLDSGVGAEDIGSEEQDMWLGEYGSEKFSFAQMEEFDVQVSVSGGNIFGPGDGVDEWWEWIVNQVC